MNASVTYKPLSRTALRNLGLSVKSSAEEIEVARRARVVDRRERKMLISMTGALAGLVAKQALILRGKGKNGNSMSPALRRAHANAADRILTLA